MKNILEKIANQMADNLYLGASLSIYQEGHWHTHYFGESQPGQPTQAGLIYDLASVSKVVGVATVMTHLIFNDTFELDTSLTTYYPDFEDRTVTLRQLLTHTSGIDPYIPNRDQLDFAGLKAAIHQIKVTADKQFHYTDINFILLGFLLEKYYQLSLDDIFKREIFEPWQMSRTSFGPVKGAVPTLEGIENGVVHDPKAKVLGTHCGSAGLFSGVVDLQKFIQHYLVDAFASHLWQNFSHGDKPRSLGWNLDGDWLDHTGYTGPFIMVNRKAQQAVIFLTNRTYAYDDRPLWIARRRELRDVIKSTLAESNRDKELL